MPFVAKHLNEQAHLQAEQASEAAQEAQIEPRQEMAQPIRKKTPFVLQQRIGGSVHRSIHTDDQKGPSASQL